MRPIAQYSFRRSVLESTKTYSLFDERIVIDGGNAPQIHLLSEVRGVRLQYEHTKQREYYQCVIQTTRGKINLRHVD